MISEQQMQQRENLLTTDVIFEEISGVDGDVGLITLNRPQALNSLNHQMILAMLAQLKIWATANHIKAVIIQAAPGRAFCAGGDLRLIYNLKQQNEPDITRFFYDEYHLNKLIYHFPKPYIALLDGITMGGGVGVSIHGAYRIGTDKLTFAMPETGIGFFPDIGGTYFLPRLSGYIGFYIALTGIKLKIAECMALGITQYQIKSEQMPQIIEAIVAHSIQKTSLQHLFNDFNLGTTIPELLAQRAMIDEYFSLPTMEAIVQALQKNQNEFCQQALTEINKKSPTSLKVTLRALQAGKQLDFDGCMQQEYRLTSRFLQSHDFMEGIRALIVDKDQKPNWQLASLSEVTNEQINHYFAPLAKELL
jgi:enoyl-CoA hydratase/carnithine racemase